MNLNANKESCFYCKNEPSSKEHIFKHKMWFVTKRTIIPPGIKYKELEVSIERCANCYGKHHKPVMRFVWVALIVILWLYIRFNVGEWPEEGGALVFAYFISILGAIGGVGLVIMLWEFFFFKMINKIPRENDVTSHIKVAELEKAGWLSSKPNPKTAQVSKPRDW